MRLGKRTLAVVAMAATAALLSGCASGGGGGAADDASKTLTLWDFESDTSAMGIAWNQAIKTFEKETGAKVKFEAKSFEQIRSTASQVLNSDKAPDVLEYNKGNATAGLLASQGLLSNLDDAVKKYGWADKLAPSLQTTAKYDENGIMGSGSWYGVPNYTRRFTKLELSLMPYLYEVGLEAHRTVIPFMRPMQLEFAGRNLDELPDRRDPGRLGLALGDPCLLEHPALGAGGCRGRDRGQGRRPGPRLHRDRSHHRLPGRSAAAHRAGGESALHHRRDLYDCG